MFIFSFSPSTTDALPFDADCGHELLRILRVNYPAKGCWFRSRIFPSGRGVSIFPVWRAHISAGLFLSPEADDRTGLMQPRGKDGVRPGDRDLSRVAPALLERRRLQRGLLAAAQRVLAAAQPAAVSADHTGQNGQQPRIRRRCQGLRVSFYECLNDTILMLRVTL